MQFLKRLVVALACALTLGLACLLALLIQNPETEEHEHTWIIIFLVVLLLAGILIASCLYLLSGILHIFIASAIILCALTVILAKLLRQENE